MKHHAPPVRSTSARVLRRPSGPLCPPSPAGDPARHGEAKSNSASRRLNLWAPLLASALAGASLLGACERRGGGTEAESGAKGTQPSALQGTAGTAYAPAALSSAEVASALRASPVFRAAVETPPQKELAEASIPAPCYTATGKSSNPCWVCHTVSPRPNTRDDQDLQSAYAFSELGRDNHWTNLFVDRSEAVAKVPDAEILAYIRQDNYAALKEAVQAQQAYPGWRPDLELRKGYDALGFAADGSGWRALRYKPFAGSFWPTNGSSDETLIRLPEAFRRDARGQESLEHYRANLSILEAALAAPVDKEGHFERTIEPLDEKLLGEDLDGDGRVEGTVSKLQRLPPRYLGAASGFAVRRGIYPAGTEFLHFVRYVDPDAPGLLSPRMKEVRYSKKVEELDMWAMQRAFEKEANEKEEGLLPRYRGSALVGLRNAFGWQLQGFIEGADGSLRLQTEDEHKACMGCHGALGVTVDHTFAFPRKVPGAGGWRPQDLRGMKDVPQAGHKEPEVLTYFRRVGAGDELRANEELLARFSPGGALRTAELARAAKGGDQDLAWLLSPSRERALALAKAYRELVRAQDFVHGRDPSLRPARNVHRRIEPGPTELAAARTYLDGRLHLDWVEAL